MTRSKFNAKPQIVGPSEAALHKSVADYLRRALKPPTIWTTIGHGGGGKIRGAQLKAMGVQKGWPDIVVMTPNEDISQTIVVGIELKSRKGTMSPEQKAMREAFMATWAWYFKATSVEQVETFLHAAKVPLHASVHGIDVRLS